MSTLCNGAVQFEHLTTFDLLSHKFSTPQYSQTTRLRNLGLFSLCCFIASLNIISNISTSPGTSNSYHVLPICKDRIFL